MTSAPHVGGAPAAAPIPAMAGIGLRFPHHGEALSGRAIAPWFEVHPENYLSGVAADTLSRVRERYPLSLHATGLSLGSADGVDPGHLRAIAALAERIAPGLVSDHLSWSAVGGLHVPDLLPIPYTREALAVFARNIDQVQTALRRPILIENPSVYLGFKDVDHAEGEFLAALVARAGCGVLLDINNVAVSAWNLGEDPAARLTQMLDALPAEAIGEIHLAGHTAQAQPDGSVVKIDDHGSRVSEEVKDLFAAVIGRIGARPTLIEWDTDIPPFAVLGEERAAAQAILDHHAAAAVRQVTHVAAG